MIEITSKCNPKIKEIIKLRKKNKRDENKLFVIEGFREILRAIDGNIEFESLFISPKLFLGENENQIIDFFCNNKIPVYECEKSIFEKISLRERPDGLIAIAKQRHLYIGDLDKVCRGKKKILLVIVESIEKPGNLGSILRSSDGVGVDAVIVCDQVTDIYNPNVIRASIGTVFTNVIIEADSKEVIEFIKTEKISIVATTPGAKKEYTDVDLAKNIAIAMGSEQYGLSQVWLDMADIKVKIPMLGKADSLNVATATTIMLYETLRQRK